MLKWKKGTGSDALALTFSTKEKIFNKDFCIALGIAAGMHLLALLLFTVHTIVYSGSNSVLSPVTVMTEPLEIEKNAAITAEIFNDPIAKRQIPPPPKMGQSNKDSQLLFKSREPSISLKNTLPDWPTELPPTSPLTITPTGSLAGRVLKVTPKLPAIKTFGDFDVIHQVRVDETSGEIFWFKLQKSSGKSPIDQMAERLLKNLRFETTGKNEISSGTIEWKFHLEANHD